MDGEKASREQPAIAGMKIDDRFKIMNERSVNICVVLSQFHGCCQSIFSDYIS